MRYARRQPDSSALYRIVAEHSETVLAQAEASSLRGGYPQYVKDEVAAYLRCGLLVHGFARFACKACGAERLVAYSCKNRGLCPSCITKRSALTAAHLCDAVLPLAPYRQWTLSLPFALRFGLIRAGRLFTAVIRTFVRTVFAWQRRRAKALGYAKPHTGSVSFAQRFGSLLQLNPHAHTWIPDGAFVETDEGELGFVRLPPPTDEDVQRLCIRIAERVVRLCHANEDAEPLEDDDEAVMASVQAEAVRPPVRRPHFFDDVPASKVTPLSSQHGGFSLHAGLWVEASDRKGLERLLRYGSRPPFAQKRLSLTPSGRVRLKLRKPYHTGQTELVLEPEAFVRRLFAIIPPPRWHLTRYHGMFSGHHRMRSRLAALVPDPPDPAASPPPRTGREGGAQTDDEPLLNARSRLCYAKLLSRVFEQDIGRCEHCGGALRLLACIDDPDAIATILNHLGLDTQAPRAAPARSPPQLALDWD